MEKSFRLGFKVTLASFVLYTGLSAVPALAGQGDCSQPLSDGPAPVATDCLFILNAAVSLTTCSPVCICAPSGELPISATDALVCLRKAVGGAIPLLCPCGSGGSTSTTSSTRLETTTTLFATTTMPPPLLTAVDEQESASEMCVAPR
jgi:hypothetical protein